jgi:hypothetical protein
VNVAAFVTFFDAHRLSWKKVQDFAAEVAKTRPASDPLRAYPTGARNTSAGASAIEQARAVLKRFLDRDGGAGTEPNELVGTGECSPCQVLWAEVP